MIANSGETVGVSEALPVGIGGNPWIAAAPDHPRTLAQQNIRRRAMDLPPICIKETKP